MLACVALRKPKLHDGKYSKDDYRVMTDKIESMFTIGVNQKHDSLVLGAFGCGVFYNPPAEVAKNIFDYGKEIW
jgi:uncharacterized protein (TIGR02452 family)